MLHRLYCWYYENVLHRFGWCSALCNFCYGECMDAMGTDPAQRLEVISEHKPTTDKE